MLDHAIGPNVIRALTTGMTEFLDRHADRGWTTLDDFRGLRRDAVVPHARIGRPAGADYHGGLDEGADCAGATRSSTRNRSRGRRGPPSDGAGKRAGPDPADGPTARPVRAGVSGSAAATSS